MARKTLLTIVFMVGASVLAGSAYAETMKGVCTITASVHGGKKFATLKCAKKLNSSDYQIRSTVWEKDDRAAYGKLARFAGRRFTCDLTRGSTVRNGDTETTNYQLSKCR
jgi:hypothetical protein